MKTVAEVIGVSRSNLVERLQERPKKRIGRPPLPDEELVAEIKAVIAELPTLRLPSGPCHPQAPDVGRRPQAAQSQTDLSGDEGPRSLARSPCRWCRAAARRSHRHG